MPPQLATFTWRRDQYVGPDQAARLLAGGCDVARLNGMNGTLTHKWQQALYA
jgi:hypothetical protein